MPASEFDPQVEELTARWQRAELLIAGILGSAALGATRPELEQAAADVARILSDLLHITARWIEQNVPQMYRQGAAEAARSMAVSGAQNAADRLMRLDRHRRSLQDLAEGLLEDMARATEHTSADARRALREMARRQLAEAMARTNPQARVADFGREMEREGVAFVDRSGRRWRPSRYAETVLLTQTGSILNAGALNAAIELGSPGVRVSDGGPGDVDEPCRRANGQVWGLAFALANLLEHPRCRRAFAPLPRSWRGRIDRGAERSAA